MEEEAGNREPGFLGSLLVNFFPYILAFLLGVGLTAVIVKQQPMVLGLAKGAGDIQREQDALVNQVGRLIDLPKDEKPTVATVTDVEKVKDQPFFKNAKNGDKVLIYTNARKAILFRPGENRIIEVGAVNINQGQASPSPSESPTGSPTPSPTPKPTESPAE